MFVGALLGDTILLLKVKLLSARSRTRGIIIRSGRPGSIVFIAVSGTNGRVVQVVGTSRGPHFRRPGTPHFLLASQGNGFTLNVKKCIGLTTRCSFNNVSSGVSFCPTLVPNEKRSCMQGRFRVSTAADAVFLGLIKRASLLNSFIICATNGFHNKDNGVFRLEGTCISTQNFATNCSCNSFVSLNGIPTAVSFTNPGKVSVCRTARVHCRRTLTGNLGTNVNIRVPIISKLAGRRIDVTGRQVPGFPICIRCN